MTRTPLIGITTYLEPASWGVWRDVPAALLPHAYVRAVEDAGGLPVLLPPPGRELSPADAAALVDALDGLVLAGGADVDPARFGAARHPSVQASQPWRDDAEFALTDAAVAADLPVLGVCRGMQVMAVAAGGRLHQHVPDLVGNASHGPAPGVYGEHDVAVRPGTVLHDLVGGCLTVHSYHHQAVAEAPGYEISATAPDGVVEAMEVRSARFRVAVQWHPEVRDSAALFSGLVAAARGRVTGAAAG